MIVRALTAIAAPAGARTHLSIFYFHRVLAHADPLLPEEPDARTFDRILGWIGSQFRVLDPLEACDRLFDNTLPSRPAVVTFDDGYRDNYTVALPILQRQGMQAVFFVSTGFLGGGAMFNDRVIEAVRRSTNPVKIPGRNEALPVRSDEERQVAIARILAEIKHLPPDERLERVVELERTAAARRVWDIMMRPEEVAALHRAGMRVGGHTRSHPILLALNDADARTEIEGGLDDLSSIAGERPQIFAYPNGKPGRDFDRRHVAMVEQAGCRYAFTTQPGTASRRSERLELPRFTPWDRTEARFALRALANIIRPFAA